MVSAQGRGWARWSHRQLPTEDSWIRGRGACISIPLRICFSDDGQKVAGASVRKRPGGWLRHLGTLPSHCSPGTYTSSQRVTPPPGRLCRCSESHLGQARAAALGRKADSEGATPLSLDLITPPSPG